MIKRIFLLALCIAVMMGTVSFASFTDVDEEGKYGKAIYALYEAGILSGYGNGEFGSKDYLTRAQFAKIIVVLTGYEDAAKTKNAEVFNDVPASHWAVGYINVASSLGLITGYPNGSFGADEKITYAQALTIIIRTLGYTEAEVGTNWPVDYINKADELEITKGLSFGRNDYVTREVAAYLIYNSLTAKEGSGAKTSVIKKVEDVVIFGVNSLNSGIAEDEVVTSGGVFKKGSGYSDDILGKKVTLRVNLDNEIIMAIPQKQACIVYTAVAGEGDELETIENGTVKINFGSKVYFKGSETTYTAVSSSITAGSKVYKYSDYIYIEYVEKEKNDEKEKDYSGIYESFGEVIKKYEDVVIYGDNSVNAGIAKDEVLTTAGTFKKGTAYKSEYLGKEVELRVNTDNEIVLVSPNVQNATVYTAILGSMNEVETIENGTADVDITSVVYYKGLKHYFSDVYQTISFGSKVYFYDDYVYISEKVSGEKLDVDEETLKKAFGSADASIDYDWLNSSYGEVIKKYDEVIIYGDNSVNAGIAKDEVATTAGTLKKGRAFDRKHLGKEVDLYVNSDSEIIAIIPRYQSFTVYTAILGGNDEIETVENGTIDIEMFSNVYYKGKKGTFYEEGPTISFGSKVYIYDDYIYIEEKSKETELNEEESIKKAFGSEDAAIDYEWLKNSSGETLIKYEDVIIYGVNRINSAVPTEHVMTTEGLIKKGNVFDEKYLGRKVELRVNTKDGIVAIIPEDEATKGCTLLSAYSDKIETKEEGVKEIDGKIPVYYKGTPATYNDVYGILTPGSNVFIYEDYIYVEENELIGPYTVTKDYSQIYEFFGDIGNAIVTLDGETASVSDIEKYDVVYYNDKTGRVYAYSERVTGIYDKALPSKSNLASIILSGTTYSAISADARKKIDDTPGAFKINDRITLLFGHDGSVVDVVDIDGKTLGDMGVVLRAYSKISTEDDTLGKNEYFADIMLADGRCVTYKTDIEYKDTDYKEYIGKFSYIKFLNNGAVKIEPVKENKLTGEFDKSVPSYAGLDLQQNYSILELVYAEKYGEAVVRKINLKDIQASKLSSADVIHVEYANEMNDIAVIYVNNITNDSYVFGVLNKATKDEEANFTYELKSSTGTATYRGSAGWDFVKGEAVMALIIKDKTSGLHVIGEIKELYEVANCSKIDSYTDTKIKVNGKVYPMDENVSVVYKSIGDSNWNITTLKDLNKNVESGIWKAGNINIYADKKANGKVRVIRVTLK